MSLTAAEALRAAVPRLVAAGVEDAPRDARRLLAHALGIAADRVTLHLGDVLTPEQGTAFDQAIAARAARQPVAQIVGQRSFWGRDFAVTRDTLDPRPETECLIEAALCEPYSRVIDLGTGTGCLLLTSLAERPSATGIGTDTSGAALAVARGNAERLGLAARAEFVGADWWQGVTGRFDLILSNPPYIAQDELAGLAPEVRDWEPMAALSPGGDGLDAYRALAGGCPRASGTGRAHHRGNRPDPGPRGRHDVRNRRSGCHRGAAGSGWPRPGRDRAFRLVSARIARHMGRLPGEKPRIRRKSCSFPLSASPARAFRGVARVDVKSSALFARKLHLPLTRPRNYTAHPGRQREAGQIKAAMAPTHEST